jgi:hypothetical protein
MFKLKNVCLPSNKSIKQSTVLSEIQTIDLSINNFGISALLNYKDSTLFAISSNKQNLRLLNLEFVKFSKKKKPNQININCGDKETKNLEEVILKNEFNTDLAHGFPLKIIELKRHYIILRFNVILSLNKFNKEHVILFGNKKNEQCFKDVLVYRNYLLVIYSNTFLIVPFTENCENQLEVTDSSEIRKYTLDCLAQIESIHLSCNQCLIVISGYSQKLFDRYL